jgi:hypothetical protein
VAVASSFEDVLEDEDVRGRNFERPGQAEEGLVGRVAPALLEVGDVSYMKLAFFGELLLAQLRVVSEEPDCFPKGWGGNF